MNDTLDLPDIISADDLFDGAPAEVPGELRTPAGVLKQVAQQAAVSKSPALVQQTPAGDMQPKTLSVKETVLALFRETEPGLRSLVERYLDVVYDAKTSKGLKDMKAARHDLRENGRFAVQRAEERVKKELNGAKAVVTEEAARLIAITKSTEDGYDKQIADREAEIEAEKVEAARKEAEAVAENVARCAKLTDTIAKAQGRTSAQIGNAIAHIEALVIDPAKWGGRADFVAAGEGAKEATLAALRKMKIDAKTAEDNAALRAENERLAAALAVSQRKEAEAAAERQRVADETAAAARKAEDDAHAAAQAKADAAAEIARLQEKVVAAAPPVVVENAPAPEPAPAPRTISRDPRFNADAVTPMAAPAEPPAPSYNECLDAQLQEPAPDVDPVAALLAHLHVELNGKFPSHPKPSIEWWAELKRLAAEVQA